MNETPPIQQSKLEQELTQDELFELAGNLLSGEEPQAITPDGLCQQASILYRYGILKQERAPLFEALNRLMHAEEMQSPLNPSWHHLWGNILVHLGRLIHDYSFVEKGLAHYIQATTEEINTRLFWDCGQAWIFLGIHSSEFADIQKGLEKFAAAERLGCSAPHFFIDYAIGLMVIALQTGEPGYLEKGLAFVSNVISESEGQKQLHERAWMTYAVLCKQRYYLTHLQSHFEEADVALCEAILSASEIADLWLEWGEFYLYAGWLRHDMKLMEIALDKLTSSKVKEADTLRVAALLGKALVSLGLYLEDVKLMQEGKERILAALDVASKHAALTNAWAFAELSFGLYFSDPKRFVVAAAYFEKGIENDSLSIQDWHGLFLTYVTWGMALEDSTLVRKGIHMISRLCSLRPFASIHWNEWGIALVQLKQLETDREPAQSLIEEAIIKFQYALSLKDDPEFLYNLGGAFDQLGDLSGEAREYERAIEIFSQLHEQLPQEPHIRYRLALALSHLGEYCGDAESLEHACALFRSLADADVEDGVLWGDLGYTLLNLSELIYDSIHPEKGEELRREAEKRLLHAVEAGDSEANYHLACLYSLTGYFDASIRFLRRAEALDVLPPQEDLEHDEWLENVRATELFKEFIGS